MRVAATKERIAVTTNVRTTNKQSLALIKETEALLRMAKELESTIIRGR